VIEDTVSLAGYNLNVAGRQEIGVCYPKPHPAFQAYAPLATGATAERMVAGLCRWQPLSEAEFSFVQGERAHMAVWETGAMGSLLPPEGEARQVLPALVGWGLPDRH
jgi:hypothetical protein